MILHIKPSAEKHNIFRFKSNFIRFCKDFANSKVSAYDALIEGVNANGDGIVESSSNIDGQIQNIRTKYTKAATDEIKALLAQVAKELDIPL